MWTVEPKGRPGRPWYIRASPRKKYREVYRCELFQWRCIKLGLWRWTNVDRARCWDFGLVGLLSPSELGLYIGCSTLPRGPGWIRRENWMIGSRPSWLLTLRRWKRMRYYDLSWDVQKYFGMPWNVCDIRMVSEERAKLADLCEVIFVDQENMMMMVMGNEWNGTPAK